MKAINTKLPPETTPLFNIKDTVYVKTDEKQTPFEVVNISPCGDYENGQYFRQTWAYELTYKYNSVEHYYEVERFLRKHLYSDTKAI